MAGYQTASLTPDGIKRHLKIELQERGEGLDEEVWQALVEDDKVGGVQEGLLPVNELADLHATYLHNRERWGTGSRRRRQESQDLPPDDRLVVLSDLLSQRAAQEAGVLSFRADVLNGSLLAWEDVETWIKEQREKDGPFTWYLEVAVPDGYLLRQGKTGFILTEPPLTVSQEAAGWGVYPRYLAFRIPGHPWRRQIPTRLGGVLDVLRTLTEQLANKYSWQSADATVFVLTGLPVRISKGRITKNLRFPHTMTSRLTIEVDPRVSPREVLAIYRKHRREILGGAYKPMDRKHLELARFHEAQKKGTWRERMAEWNSSRPSEWHYIGTDSHPDPWRNFRRDCIQAWSRLFEEEANNGEAR